MKVIYLLSQKPVSSVIGKTIHKAAIWGETTIKVKSIKRFCMIKLYVMKYKTQSNTIFPPPQQAYLNNCRGINEEKGIYNLSIILVIKLESIYNFFYKLQIYK